MRRNSGSDVVDRPPRKPRASLLVAPEVREAILRALRGIPKEDREDAVQEVLVRALAVADPPETLGGWIAVCVGIARNLSADEVRRKVRRARVDEGPLGDPDAAAVPDESSREVLDDKRKIAFVKGEVPERTMAILQAVADGAEQREVAKELGLSPQTVYNEVARTRAKLRARWAAYLAAATVAVLAVIVWISLREGREDVAHRLTPEQERAAQMRKAALFDCKEKHWASCLEGLDRARALDREGDQTPEIVALRSAAESAMAQPNARPEQLPTLPASGGDE
jgi:RNA polymerase sigma factor (sigma-70 family)